MTGQVDGDRLGENVRSLFPYPLAATYHRAFYSTNDMDEMHELLLDLFELVVKYCAALVVSQYLDEKLDDPRLDASLLQLQRPSLGHWQSWLRDGLSLYARSNLPLRVPELATFYLQKDRATLLQAYKDLWALPQFGRETKGPSSVTPREFFEALGTYRNRLAHGVRPSRYDREQAARILKAALLDIFGKLSFLAEYRLIYIGEIKVVFEAGRPRYTHQFTSLMGDNPAVGRPQTLDTALPDGKVYLLDKTSDFTPCLTFHPLLIYQYCSNCSKEQVFLLNAGQDGATDYLGYPCTHHFHPDQYFSDVREILHSLRGKGGLDVPANPPLAAPCVPEEPLLNPFAEPPADGPEVETPDDREPQASEVVEAGSTMSGAAGRSTEFPASGFVKNAESRSRRWLMGVVGVVALIGIGLGIAAIHPGSPAVVPTVTPISQPTALPTRSSPTTPTTLLAISTTVPSTTAVPRAPTPSPVVASTISVAKIKPEDLLMATLTRADLSKLVGNADAWWPTFPAFYVPPFAGDPLASNPGQRFLVAQGYQQVGAASGTIQTAITLFDNDSDASTAFANLAHTRDQGGTPGSGPAVGEESRYYTHQGPLTGALPYDAVLRFRTGPVIVKVTESSPTGFATPADLARIGKVVLEKTQHVLTGQVAAPVIPSELASVMPPGTPDLGPISGTAVVSPESWALVDQKGNSQKVLNGLVNRGVTELGYRVYSLPTNHEEYLEVTLFPAKTNQDAIDWVQGWVENVRKSGSLAPGKTGAYAAFQRGGQFYELMFAKGNYAVDVTCTAPWGKISADCEPAVRRLAEGWYSALPTDQARVGTPKPLPQPVSGGSSANSVPSD